MREQRVAFSLDELAERVVCGRLRFGPESSPTASPPGSGSGTIRLWDATDEWQIGNRVIVARCPAGELDVFLAEIVEITTIPPRARVRLDRSGEEVTYIRTPAGDTAAERWREKLHRVVQEKLVAPELSKRAKAVLAQYGTRIIDILLAALRADTRFLELENRWFLREILEHLAPAQLQGLFRILLGRTKPSSTAELASLMSLPLPAGDVGLFSLYQALVATPKRFRNVGRAAQPLWEVIAPTPVPPERAVALYYAYDPATYEVLVHPGQHLTSQLTRRLQELEL